MQMHFFNHSNYSDLKDVILLRSAYEIDGLKF